MRGSVVVILFCLLGANVQAQQGDEYYTMAIEKREKKDYSYASILIDKAIQLNKNNPWYYLEKATIQLKLSDSDQAIRYIKKAIDADTTFAEAYSRAGRFYSSRGFPDSALVMFDNAIRLAKDDTVKHVYLMNRGTHKASYMDYEGAAADLEEVLRFNPTHFSALNNISNVYDALGRRDEAIQAMKKCMHLEGNAVGPYVNLGLLYSKTDYLDSAIYYFDKAIETDPSEPLIYSNRGFAFYKLQRYNDAIRDINKSLSLYPTNSYAYKNLGMVYLSMGKKQEGCTALQYAEQYGYAMNYGDEVNRLLKKYCESN